MPRLTFEIIVPTLVQPLTTRASLLPTTHPTTHYHPACAHAGKLDMAVGFIDKIKATGVVPAVGSYTAAISACANNADSPTVGPTWFEDERPWERALSLLADMRRLGVTPNIKTYSLAMLACRRAERWAETLDILADMKTDGVAPVSTTFNSNLLAFLFSPPSHTLPPVHRTIPTILTPPHPTLPP